MLGLEVQSDEACGLLDAFDSIKLGGWRGELVNIGEQPHDVVSEDAACDLHLLDGKRDGIAITDGDSVAHTITRVDDETGVAAMGDQGCDSLVGDVDFADLEFLEHNLHHFLSVFPGILGRLGKEDAALAGVLAELLLEDVVPDLLHIVPVMDDTRYDGVRKREDTSPVLSFVSNI